MLADLASCAKVAGSIATNQDVVLPVAVIDSRPASNDQVGTGPAFDRARARTTARSMRRCLSDVTDQVGEIGTSIGSHDQIGTRPAVIMLLPLPARTRS